MRATRTLFGLSVITPLVLAGAVGATPRFPGRTPVLRDAAVTPLAAVARVPDSASGPAVVAVERPPADVHIAAASMSAPPPAAVVYSPGMLQIPSMALSAYRNAEQKMSIDSPDCGVSWNLLAGIGRIESMHANFGATDARGTALQPILGPALDGTLPGNEIIVQSNAAGRVVYARAIGPMQFLPGTWSRYAADGDGDGKADPQNLYDSTLAAARYLCSGGLNLRDQSQVMSAILRYNNSMAYARNVLGWAAAYATGVFPVDLPPITGPAPPIADMHLENPEGLGPDSPLNVHGLASSDPTSVPSLISLEQSTPQSQAAPDWAAWLPSWMRPASPSSSLPKPSCGLICLEPQSTPGAPGALGAPMPPYAVPPAPMPPYAVPPAPMPPYAVPAAPDAPAGLPPLTPPQAGPPLQAGPPAPEVGPPPQTPPPAPMPAYAVPSAPDAPATPGQPG